MSLAFRNILVSVMILTSLHGYSQDVKTQIDTSFLKKRIPQMMDSAKVIGASIAIVKDGKLYWHKGFGIKNKQKKTRVTDATMFQAASLSKVVFAYIVLQLVDQKKINLDIPLFQYMPIDTLQSKFLKSKIYDHRLYDITARMCLSHSTGFPNGRYGNITIKFDPGTDLSYSGEGFTYLQRTVEYITHKRLEDLAKEYVFEPLKMTHSSYLWREKFAPLMTEGHWGAGAVAGHRKEKEDKAAYSLVTNAEDMGKFLAALLTHKGFGEETFKMMYSKTSTAKRGMLKSLSWGLGMGIFGEGDQRGIWHWGDFGTFRAYLVGFPHQKTGLVWLTNSANGLNMAQGLCELAIGGDHIPFSVLSFKQYDAPSAHLYKTIMKYGVEVAMSEYNVFKKMKSRRLNFSTLNNLGKQLLKANRKDDAIQIFKMNILSYPDVYVGYNSLGDTYYRIGNKVAAKSYYQQSLKVKPGNAYALRMLRIL